MSKNLVIVESPAKAKTIEKFLGKDYKVLSSFGHVRDLPSKGMSIDIENDFTPQYAVSADKKKVIADLRKAVKAADTVWLASDEDREGEAIAWHLKESLKLNDASTKRIVFNEITKTAIVNAIENPRGIDYGLVDAQQARRILDRLVGYELSPVLWKKVKRGLSAGRVQSVAVRLIVDREREINAHDAEVSYKIKGQFTAGDTATLEAEAKQTYQEKTDVEKLFESLKAANYSVSDVQKAPGKRNPSAPLTTSTLQQEASRRSGFSVRQTMSVAQRLYESGAITYMRTDSLNLSSQAINQAKEVIAQEFGADMVETRAYKTKSSGAQEAHEAIRPTDLARAVAGGDDRQKKLYKLIRNRTLASQMKAAQIERTTITIDDDKANIQLQAKGEVLVAPGWMRLYPKDLKESLLPPVKVGDSLKLNQLNARQTYSRSPARYTEASLVKKLEELGIGRPSTYAPTISTIQDRGYIEKSDLEGKQRDVTTVTLKDNSITSQTEQETYGADKNKLIPTDIALVVNDFLVEHFATVVDFDFTAHVEEEFDDIARGKQRWQTMIKDFYKPFHKKVEAAETIDRKDAGGMKELGTDPKSQRPVFARIGRYGPMVQIGKAEDEEKPKFAPMPSGATIETVTLEDALAMFALPRVVGTTEAGEEIIANIGRFGPYIKIGKMFVSIKPEDPFTISQAKAREFYAEKQKAEANKYITTFEKEGIQVINGRYGPYVTDGTKNAKIPKGTEPKDLSLADCQKLLAKAQVRKRRRG